MAKLKERELETPVSPDEDTVEVPVANDLPAIREDLAAMQLARGRAIRTYVYLPLIFLTVALLGGLRLSGTDGSLIFVRPALICLIFAAILVLLFFRAGMLRLDGWFSEQMTGTQTVANGLVLASLFAAATQIFNSLIPEQGLPFWIISFCFLWVLWNNLFAEFDVKRLLKSLGAMFGLAFVTKYMVLANLTAPGGRSWLRSLSENPAQEAATWLLDLPRFSAGTGYIQFFAVLIFLLGLFLTPSATNRDQ